MLAVSAVAGLFAWASLNDAGSSRATSGRSVLPVPSYTKIPVVVFIGDSYTAGAGASNETTSFVDRIARYEGWSAINLGRGGTGYRTTSTIPKGCGNHHCGPYKTMIDLAAAEHPNVIVVSGGRNDALLTAASEREAIHVFYDGLRKRFPDAAIVATSPIWESESPPPTLTSMRIAVRQSVRAVGGVYLDLGEPLAGHPSWIGPDGIHPNDKGHEAIAVAFSSALRKTPCSQILSCVSTGRAK